MDKEGHLEGQYENLRTAERSNLVFYLRVFEGSSSSILGYLVDVSEQGFMLLSDYPIAVNKDYRLRMRLPSELKEGIEIAFNAVSRWCKTDVQPDFYRTGFAMHDLDPYPKELLTRAIREFGYE